MATTKVNNPAASDILLALVVEAGGLAIVTIVAGVSDQAANLMILVMAGLTLLWLIGHASQTTAITGMLANIEKAGATAS